MAGPSTSHIAFISRTPKACLMCCLLSSKVRLLKKMVVLFLLICCPEHLPQTPRISNLYVDKTIVRWNSFVQS